MFDVDSIILLILAIINLIYLIVIPNNEADWLLIIGFVFSSLAFIFRLLEVCIVYG